MINGLEKGIIASMKQSRIEAYILTLVSGIIAGQLPGIMMLFFYINIEIINATGFFGISCLILGILRMLEHTIKKKYFISCWFLKVGLIGLIINICVWRYLYVTDDQWGVILLAVKTSVVFLAVIAMYMLIWINDERTVHDYKVFGCLGIAIAWIVIHVLALRMKISDFMGNLPWEELIPYIRGYLYVGIIMAVVFFLMCVFQAIKVKKDLKIINVGLLKYCRNGMLAVIVSIVVFLPIFWLFIKVSP